MHKTSKILLGIILLLGITFMIILLKGHQTPSTNIIDNKLSVPNEKLSQANLQGIQQPETKELKETTLSSTAPVIEFKNIEYSLTSSGFEFNGQLYSENTNVEGLIVKFFCNDKEVSNTLIGKNDVTLSDTNGNFKITSKCVPNDVAYAQLQYGDVTFESTHVVVPHGRFGHMSASGPLEINGVSQTTPAGVPEYPTLTIGLAVIAVLLGLIFLRKR